jgi:hypothetical protein
MVLTGVEIVGIVLAVVPLCFTALEHHRDLFRPFGTALRYRKAAIKARSSFSVVFTDFHQLMQLIAQDLALPPRQLGILFVGQDEKVDASAWNDDDLDHKFADYFGMDLYISGIVPLLSMIFEKIREIADILELQLDRTAANTKVHSHPRNGFFGFNAHFANIVQTAWNDIEKARFEFFIPAKSEWSAKELKNRMKLVFKSGTLDPKCKDLVGMVEQLTRFRSRARQLMKDESYYKPKSKWPLEKVQRHAASLYRALEGLKRCSAHTNHYVRLQLDTRLENKARARKRKMASSASKHSFKLVMAPDEKAPDWHSFCVYMDADVQPWKPSMVRFEQQPLKTRQVVTTGICDSLKQSPAPSFCVDDQYQIHELSTSDEHPATVLSSIGWTTLSTILSSSGREPTFYQTLNLALTIASSFLELYFTEWITDAWNATDISFMHDHTVPKDDVAYISLTLNTQGSPAAQAPAATTVSARKTLALAAILLEIGTCKPLAHWRKPGESERETVLRCLFEGRLDGRPDCFVDAIRFCLKTYDKDTDFSLQNFENLQELATEVVAPFDECLRYVDMPAPT